MNDKLFLEDTPENVGISSNDIQNLINDFEKYGFYMHDFLIIRYGKIIAEGYYKPFKKDELRRIYSISKTFTATAIGMLCDEGKISLDDYVYKYFLDKCPSDLHPYLKKTKIRDLLMMATPFSENTYNALRGDKDWAWTFFNTKPDHPAGTVFCYDTSGTHVLSSLVERVTGMPYLEYLKNKGFRELGFSENAWCIKAPEGTSWGGSGVMCSARDLARLGMLYLNNGKINGKQYLSEKYIAEATKKQIDNNTFGHERQYLYGYGYKIWITRDNSFSFMGIGDQEVICVPDKDIIFVCNGGNHGNSMSEAMIYELLWKHIVDKAENSPLSEDIQAYNTLQEKLSSLELYKPQGKAHTDKEKEIDGITYALNDNEMGISKMKVDFLPEYGKLSFTTPRGDKEILFGYGGYKIAIFPETHYYGDTILKPANRGYRYASLGRWTEDNKLSIKVNIIDDYLGNLNITLSYKGDELCVCMLKTAEWFLNEYSGFAAGMREIK